MLTRLGAVWSRREILWTLVQRDLRVRYSRISSTMRRRNASSGLPPGRWLPWRDGNARGTPWVPSSCASSMTTGTMNGTVSSKYLLRSTARFHSSRT